MLNLAGRACCEVLASVDLDSLVCRAGFPAAAPAGEEKVKAKKGESEEESDDDTGLGLFN